MSNKRDYNRRMAALAEYSSGDVVSYGEGEKKTGVVMEVLTSNSTVPSASGDGDREVEASGSEPKYVVAKGDSSSFAVYSDSDLSSGEINVDDVDSPASEVKDNGDEEAANEAVTAALDFNYPRSWRQSSTPNRLILLDAWSSMGGTWRSCYPEYGGKKFCSAMKDKVYGTTEWR